VNGIEAFYFSGMFLSFICLAFGVRFTQRFLKYFDLSMPVSTFLVFLFSTVLFFFSFFYTTVIEIFSFMLSSYLLSEIFSNKKTNNYQYFIGFVGALLLFSKLTYLPLFLLCIYSLLNNTDDNKLKGVFKFFFGVFIVFASFSLKQFAQYDQFFSFGVEFSKYVNEYSFSNIVETIKYGYFGIGGLFYTNIALLPIFIYLVFTFIKQSFDDKRFVFLLLWLGFSFFQTVFLVGPIFEDHLVGRMTLTALPLLLLGFCGVRDLLKEKSLKVIISALLIIWQIYITFSFVIKDSEGHYAFAFEKIVSLIDFCNFLLLRLIDSLSFVVSNILIYSTFAFISTFFIMFIRSEKIEKIFKLLISFSVVFLFIFSFSNSFLSKKNGKAFIESRSESISIANRSSAYIYIYVMDIYESLLANSKSTKQKEKIYIMRKEYFKSLDGAFLHMTPDLELAIKEKDYSFKSSVFD
jgi:hypothetical protein